MLFTYLSVLTDRSNQSGCTYHITNTNFLVMNKRFVNVYTFLHSSTDCPETFLLHLRHTRPHRKDTDCGSNSLQCTDRKNTIKIILLTGSWSFKAWITVVLYVVIALNRWLKNALTEQVDATIHGWTVLWATAVTARDRQAKASLAAVCRTNSKWSSLYIPCDTMCQNKFIEL
jgi:hypothetical protein